MTLILASASPRRLHLLRGAGLDPVVEPSGADEDVEAAGGDPDPSEVALELARRKARAVAARHAGRPVYVLGADTVVGGPAPGGGWRLLGKPADADEARGFLAILSESRHPVVTGVCAIAAADGRERAAAELTWVRMRAIAPAEIEAYVASGEWRGKAGGYAIQETADAFVTGLEGGGFDNVVGLPVRLALECLAAVRLAAEDAGRAGSAPSPEAE